MKKTIKPISKGKRIFLISLVVILFLFFLFTLYWKIVHKNEVIIGFGSLGMLTGFYILAKLFQRHLDVKEQKDNIADMYHEVKQ